MNNILIIGAGRSATALINYLLSQAATFSWNITLADTNLELAQQKLDNHPNGKAVRLDVMNVEERRSLIEGADMVVSMLPARLHMEVAHDCISLNKHLANASYISEEMQKLDEEAKKRSLVFMGEIGLDPGIDHMSAMEKIHEIQDSGGKIHTFRSYTGGLVAPESDTNPWHYKFTWNPRNVILAGRGTAQFLEGGTYKYIPYHRLFSRIRKIEIPGMGNYEVYANRDSLTYREVYGLENIPNILRGTIRNTGYCEAWDALITIGLTDDSCIIENSEVLTYHGLMESFVSALKPGSVRQKIADIVGHDLDSEVMQKLEWLDLFSDKKINLPNATPARILENLLLGKWKLEEDDKDMILMQHEFEYELNGRRELVLSTLVMKGAGKQDTAMARLVGLPLGIFVKLVMLGKINLPGVNIPVMPEVYKPVLEELKEYGVIFQESHQILD